MRAYRVIRVYGITYNMHRKLLPLEVKGIHTMPLRKLEELLYEKLPHHPHDPITRLEIITQKL